MMVVITSDIDSGDGVFIGGKHLHNTIKPMTNNELTLDQLTAISGGVTRGPGGTTCTDRPLIKIIKKLLGPVSTGPTDPNPIEDLSEGNAD
jgi:hypothetical protein